jgi:predicted ATP-grasp superfamily ATP-dependent carboligase
MPAGRKTTPRIKPPPVAIFDNYWASTLAFASSLGRQGVPLHFYGKGAGRWSRYCTMSLRCPPVGNAAEFQPWLRDQIRSGAITRIAPTTDLIAYYTSYLRGEFPEQVQRAIAPLPEIETCLIKTRFSVASELPGLPGLSTLSATGIEAAKAAAAQLGFPLILKPNSHLVVGFAERGRLLRNEADLRRHFQRYEVTPGQECLGEAYPETRWPLLQRYLPSARQRVYSVSGVKDSEGGVLSARVSYKREQWPPDVGVSTLQVGCDDARILERGLAVVNRVLSRGIFEIELLADGEHLYPIDLNPRAFGFVALDIARGSDVPWLWFRSTLERQQPAPNWGPRPSMVARSSPLQFVKAWFRRDRLETLPRKSVSMLGNWRDPLPIAVCGLQTLRHPRALLRAQLRARLRDPQG